MPYDNQGRWIKENEWEQMMREQAARGVGAFSRYNYAPPSLYPNQAAPYGSFPMTTPATPSIWESPLGVIPSDPQFAGPTVNKFEPLGSDYTPQQLGTPIEKLLQQDIPSNVVPLDPTGGLSATDSIFTGEETQVAAGPGWGFNISPDSVGVSWGVPKDLPTQDPTGGVFWPDKPIVDVLPSELPTRVTPAEMSFPGAETDYGDVGMGDIGAGHPGIGLGGGYDLSGMGQEPYTGMPSIFGPGTQVAGLASTIGPVTATRQGADWVDPDSQKFGTDQLSGAPVLSHDYMSRDLGLEPVSGYIDGMGMPIHTGLRYPGQSKTDFELSLEPTDYSKSWPETTTPTKPAGFFPWPKSEEQETKYNPIEQPMDFYDPGPLPAGDVPAKFRPGFGTQRDYYAPTDSAGITPSEDVNLAQKVFDTIMPTTQAAPVAAPAGPSAAEIERQNQAAINARLAQQATARQQQQAQAAQAAQAAVAQQAAAQQALRNFYASRAYQEEGAAAPAGLIDVASQIDTFADIGAQGGRSPLGSIDVSDRGRGPF